MTNLTEALDEANSLSQSLELAIRGAIASEILDDGELGASLEDHARLLTSCIKEIRALRWRGICLPRKS